MASDRLKIGLQAAGVALVAIGLLGGAGFWAIEKLVAAELAPLSGRVESLEKASERAASAAEETAAGITALKEETAKQTEALDWIKDALKRLETKAHSH